MISGSISDQETRTAVFSLRGFRNHVSHSHGFEFEDVIAEELDAVDLLAPRAERFHLQLKKAKNWLSARTTRAGFLPVGLEKMPLIQDYALFFFSVSHLRDLNFLSAVPGWRQRSNTAICWIQELWLHEFPRLGPLIDRLNEFDYVICSFTHTTVALAERLMVPVHYIPWGVDAVHFCPYPDPPARVIAVLGIGARHEDTHRGLIDHTNRTGQFYSYETIAGRAKMHDHRGHRQNYVSQLQRCRYFLSYVAKVELEDLRQGQVEFGLRYLEGLAAGAVVLGSRLDDPAFKENIGWTDSVIELPFACSEVGKILTELDAQPERLSAICRRNIRECLVRHDHLYRWERVLEMAGLKAHPKLTARRAVLDDLVRVIEEDAREAASLRPGQVQ